MISVRVKALTVGRAGAGPCAAIKRNSCAHGNARHDWARAAMIGQPTDKKGGRLFLRTRHNQALGRGSFEQVGSEQTCIENRVPVRPISVSLNCV